MIDYFFNIIGFSNLLEWLIGRAIGRIVLFSTIAFPIFLVYLLVKNSSKKG
jgi:hypothetical protein